MKAIIKKIILIIFMLICINQSSIVYAQDALSKATIQYLSAWTSLAAYDDKVSLLSRDILEDNNWHIEAYNEKIKNSDVKYLLANKQESGADIFMIAISGTSSWSDVKTDLKVESATFKGNTIDEFKQNMKNTDVKDSDPLVHRGFLTYVQDGFFTPNKNGEVLGESLAKKLKQNPQDKIYITGHSLGGAVAELLAARLIDLGVNKDQIQTITFGAPAVGNKIFVDIYEPQINLARITLSGDVVKNLSQIANDKFIQFNTNEQWTVDELDNDKFAHSMLLYFDKATRKYYDETANTIEKQMQEKNTCDVYIAKINYEFPNELQNEIKYINIALTDKFLKGKQSFYLSNKIESKTESFANAKKMNAKYVVFYDFTANKIKDNKSNKRYYLNASKYIYDINGNLITGYSANNDTENMTLLQSAVCLDYQLKDWNE